jgi:tRNA-dihydrouridine synthase
VPGDRRGLEVARRLVEDAGVSGIAIHPRHASQQHKGKPDYALARELVETLPAPVLLTGGLSDAQKTLQAYEETGAAAVLLARGSLGNPWIFQQLLGTRDGEPSVEEIVNELNWVIDRAEEHFGVERAGRWLRKAYPWYGERLRLPKRLNHQLCMSATTAESREFLSSLEPSGILPALSHA